MYSNPNNPLDKARLYLTQSDYDEEISNQLKIYGKPEYSSIAMEEIEEVCEQDSISLLGVTITQESEMCKPLTLVNISDTGTTIKWKNISNSEYDSTLRRFRRKKKQEFSKDKGIDPVKEFEKLASLVNSLKNLVNKLIEDRLTFSSDLSSSINNLQLRIKKKTIRLDELNDAYVELESEIMISKNNAQYLGKEKTNLKNVTEVPSEGAVKKPRKRVKTRVLSVFKKTMRQHKIEKEQEIIGKDSKIMEDFTEEFKKLTDEFEQKNKKEKRQTLAVETKESSLKIKKKDTAFKFRVLPESERLLLITIADNPYPIIVRNTTKREKKMKLTVNSNERVSIQIIESKGK